jgi:hypothetical protein
LEDEVDELPVAVPVVGRLDQEDLVRAIAMRVRAFDHDQLNRVLVARRWPRSRELACHRAGLVGDAGSELLPALGLMVREPRREDEQA